MRAVLAGAIFVFHFLTPGAAIEFIKCLDETRSVTVKRGETANLDCVAYGEPPPSAEWKWVNPRNATFEIRNSSKGGATITKLVLWNVQEEDETSYSCEIRNRAGLKTCVVSLIVIKVPNPPLNLRVDSVDTHDMSISWDPPLDENSTIISQYVIRYWSLDFWPKVAREVFTPGTAHSAVVEDLRPGRIYEATVFAENKNGRSAPATSVTLLTAADPPSAPPLDVRAEPTSANSVRITWRPPPWMNWNGKLVGYYIGIKRRFYKEPIVYKTMIVPLRESGGFYYTKISQLQSNTTYEVYVEAFNEAGSGPAATFAVKTLDEESQSDYKVQLRVLKIYGSSMTLYWSVDDHLSPLDSFVISYQSTDGQARNITVPNSALGVDHEKEYVLNDLVLGETFRIVVYAVTVDGKWFASNSDVFTTQTDLTDFLFHTSFLLLIL